MSKLTISATERDSKRTKVLVLRSSDSEKIDIKYKIDQLQEELLGTIDWNVGGTPPPSGNKPPKVDAGANIIVKQGTEFELDGSAVDSDGRIVIAKWTGPVGITITPDANDFTKAKVTAPMLEAGQDVLGLIFDFSAEDDRGESRDDHCVVTVTKDAQLPPPPPPVVTGFPLQNLDWYYNSIRALSQDGTFATKMRLKNDPILLLSNASGVQTHTIKDGWLDINTGGGNGRVYWEYYDLPQWNTNPNLGFQNVFASVFRLKGADNYSQKDGDHGTTGYTFDGKTFFGGFGWSIHATEAQSKAEWKHATPEGNELAFPYPSGKKVVQGQQYGTFATLLSDQSKNEVALNVWIDFNDGDKWQHIIKDRIWSNNAEWKSHVTSIPTNALDYNDAVKGPAFIRRHHKWDRANSGDVEIKDVMIGCLV